MKTQIALVVLGEHAIEHDHVVVKVEVGRGPEALQERNRASATAADTRSASTPSIEREHGSNNDAQHADTAIVVVRQEVTQAVWKAQNELPHGYERHHVIGQVSGEISHSLAAAAGAEAASLAAQRHEAFEAAAAAFEPAEPMREHAALQERCQFLLDEARDASAVVRPGYIVQKGRKVPL